MLDNISLSHLILAEIIVALAILVILLIVTFVRQRRLHQALLAEYYRLRRTIRAHPELKAALEQTLDEKPDQISAEHIERYLTAQRQEARQRFHNLTGSKVPHLKAEQPYPAKIAALRHQYLGLEKELLIRKKSAKDTWIYLERGYQSLLTNLTPAKTSKGDNKAYKKELLRLEKQVASLEKAEPRLRHLEHQLTNCQRKRRDLERQLKDSQKNIDKLRGINRVLQQAVGGDTNQLHSKLKGIMHNYDSKDYLREADSAWSGGISQLGSIDDISSQKKVLMNRLQEEIGAYQSHADLQQRERMQNYIDTLEKDILKSDTHILNLRQELKAAKEDVDSGIKYLAMQAETTAREDTSSGQHRQEQEQKEKQANNIEETIKVIRQDVARDVDALNQNWLSGGGHKRTLEEINQLRENNQKQRRMIIQLERELNSIRNAIAESGDDGDQSRSEEMARLERLVKECEHCIQALESEVEMLHSQLEESQAVLQPPRESGDNETTLALLSSELEAMTKQLEQAVNQRHLDGLLINFAATHIQSQSLEELAKCLVAVIKKMQFPAGFCLYSPLGRAEYLPKSRFSQREVDIIRSVEMDAPISYLNEGILFSTNRVNLLQLEPLSDDEQQRLAESVIKSVVDLTTTHIRHLESQQLLADADDKLQGWLHETIDTVENLDIKVAHQGEELNRVMTHFALELDHFREMADLSETSTLVLQNAVDECRQRITHLFSLDEEFDKLQATLVTFPKLTRP